MSDFLAETVDRHTDALGTAGKIIVIFLVLLILFWPTRSTYEYRYGVSGASPFPASLGDSQSGRDSGYNRFGNVGAGGIWEPQGSNRW